MMLKLLAIVALVLGFVASEVLDATRYNVPSFAIGNDTVKARGADFISHNTNEAELKRSPAVRDWNADPADDQLWNQVVCRGCRFFLAMTCDTAEAATYCPRITTPFDANFEQDWKTWGYADISGDLSEEDGDMTKHGIGLALAAINADPRDFLVGGDNHCYYLMHAEGPNVERDNDGDMPLFGEQRYAVNGRWYRVTGAYFKISVNHNSGIVYFMERNSPAAAAVEAWEPEIPDPDDLPLLRSSSDIAWGFWRRESLDRLWNINFFFAMQVVNEDSKEIIARALAQRGGLRSRDLLWPGISFTPLDEEYFAILGSPNCLGAAWFLIQHKGQMGQNRYIHRITVFFSTTWQDLVPNLMMWVGEAPPTRPPSGPACAAPAPSRSKPRSPENMPFPPPVAPLTEHELNMARKHIIWG